MKGESFVDADFTTAIEDGKVVATIEILSTDTAALQLKLDFDNTRLDASVKKRLDHWRLSQTKKIKKIPV